MNTEPVEKEVKTKEAVQPKEITNLQLLSKLQEIERRLEELANKLMIPVTNGR